MPMIRLTNAGQLFTRNLTLKLLCLGVAVSVWLLSSTSRRTQFELSLPLTVSDVPAGYALSVPPPATITYTLSGPAILVDGTQRSNTRVRLSMAGAVAPGTTLFMHLESYLRLPEGVTAIRVSPSALELSLKSGHIPAGGQHP